MNIIVEYSKCSEEGNLIIICFYYKILGNAQFHQNFLVDTLGWPLVNLDPGLTEGWFAPTYLLH